MFMAYAIICAVATPEDCIRINNQLRFDTEVACRIFIDGPGLTSLVMHLAEEPEPYIIRGVNCEHESADSL